MAFENDLRFDAALEDCCRRVQIGEPLERCLDDYPREYRAELARLAPVARQVARLRRDPSPEFEVRLERDLLAAVDATRRGRRGEPLARPGRLWRGLSLRLATVLMVALVVLVGGSVGAVQASDDSLPDSPLYQVKTAREWVEVILARDEQAAVGVHARQIAERGRELDKAVRANKPRRVVDVLTLRLAISTKRMVDQAVELRDRGDPQPAIRALAAVRGIQRETDRLISQASPGARPPLQRLQRFLREQERRLRLD